MRETIYNSELSSLWKCLHDGGIEKLVSDPAARTLTIVVDSLFHWEFHKLPEGTRFQIIGDGIRSIEAVEFEAWPNAVEPSRDTPYEQAKEQRKQNSEKGRYVSVSWNQLLEQINAGKEYDILNAELSRTGSTSVLKFEILELSYSDYREIKIRAEKFRYYIDNREMSLEQFQEFGAAYWNDFARRAEEFQRNGAN